MSHSATQEAADRAYLNARLDEIERDPQGYTCKGELRENINRLLDGAQGYEGEALDLLRGACGLDALNPIRAAAWRSAAGLGIAVTVSEHGSIVVSSQCNPLCVGRYATRADLLPAELKRAHDAFSAFIHGMAREGYALLNVGGTANDGSGNVRQGFTALRAVELAA